MSNFSNPHSDPVLPKPVCISSMISNVPVPVHFSRTALSHSREGGTTPLSAWMVSSITQAVEVVIFFNYFCTIVVQVNDAGQQWPESISPVLISYYTERTLR